MKTFSITLQLPPLPQPNDIAQQLLTVKINGKESFIDRPLLLTSTSVDLGSFKEGDTLVASLVYVDDALKPNRGPAQVTNVTVIDTVPPPKPGEFSLGIKQTFDDSSKGPDKQVIPTSPTKTNISNT